MESLSVLLKNDDTDGARSIPGPAHWDGVHDLPALGKVLVQLAEILFRDLFPLPSTQAKNIQRNNNCFPHTFEITNSFTIRGPTRNQLLYLGGDAH